MSDNRTNRAEQAEQLGKCPECGSASPLIRNLLSTPESQHLFVDVPFCQNNWHRRPIAPSPEARPTECEVKSSAGPDLVFDNRLGWLRREVLTVLREKDITIALLRKENDRLTDAWMCDETIGESGKRDSQGRSIPDETFRPHIRKTIERAEKAEAENAELRKERDAEHDVKEFMIRRASDKELLLQDREAKLKDAEARVQKLEEGLRSWPCEYDGENRMVMRFTREEWSRLLASDGGKG